VDRQTADPAADRQTADRQAADEQIAARQTAARQTVARQTVARQTVARQTVTRRKVDRQIDRPIDRRRVWRRAALALLLAAAAGVVIAPALPHGPDGPARMPASPEVEQRYGVHFTMVGVTADRGLVDVRFIVLDPDRTADMLSAPERLPRLVLERKNRALPSAALLPMIHDPVPGRTYYVLYRNSGGAVRKGDRVTLAFDHASVRHVLVS
jgi:hypothetical protein